ncbi:MAG: hypothetical protein ACJAUD_002010 [Crocinitomicaceae bacterium]|jgi:hypothetical protein
MKRIFFYLLIVLTVGFTQISCKQALELTSETGTPSVKSTFLERLEAIPNVFEVNVLRKTDHFTEHYELWFQQKTDPSNPNSPTFNQRVLLAHVSDDALVIVELQGYQIYSSRAGELAQLYAGNQITIEHRFFDQSRPETEIPWTDLTVRNAAEDQHLIIQALKKAVYTNNKFVTTGISKGGQTTMLHRSFYPEDVDASVCYVAPLNFEREDPRIYHFFDTVGTKKQREMIYEYQTLCFERKAEMVELLKSKASFENYEWSFSTEKAFEYYVLEYSFAFWQWGTYAFNEIPDEKATSDSLLNHVLDVSGVSFFERKGVEKLQPFFWAAMTEMGMYGYEYEPFEKYLSQKEVYTFEFTFPEGQNRPFDPASMKNVNDFIQNEAENIMFIYGGLDTWSATAVQLSDAAKSRGLLKYVRAGGHHGTRMRDFSFKKQKEMKSALDKWLEIPSN